MPLIRIEFDDSKVDAGLVEQLAQATKDIVSQATGIADVFVYANSSQIKINIAPIEIFVEMSAHKIDNIDTLFGNIKSQLSKRKQDNSFPVPINLTIIPMHWKFDVNI